MAWTHTRETRVQQAHAQRRSSITGSSTRFRSSREAEGAGRDLPSSIIAEVIQHRAERESEQQQTDRKIDGLID